MVELPNSYLWNTQISYLFEPDNRGFGKGLGLEELVSRPDLVSQSFEKGKGYAIDGYGKERLIPFPVYYDEWGVKTNQSVFIKSEGMFYAEEFDENFASDIGTTLNFEIFTELENEIVGKNESFHLFYKLVKFGRISVTPRDVNYKKGTK